MSAAIALWALLGASVHAGGQASDKKAPGPDIWERSKECAAQAEKVMTERNQRSVSNGGQGAADWSNHYSPKYEKCFVKAVFLVAGSAPKGSPFSLSYLIDAFERSDLAGSALWPIPIEVACRGEKDPKKCEQLAHEIWATFCRVRGKEVPCDGADEFIDERMTK